MSIWVTDVVPWQSAMKTGLFLVFALWDVKNKVLKYAKRRAGWKRSWDGEFWLRGELLSCSRKTLFLWDKGRGSWLAHRREWTELAKRFGNPNVHGSYQKLVEDPDVNLVYIATPHLSTSRPHCRRLTQANTSLWRKRSRSIRQKPGRLLLAPQRRGLLCLKQCQHDSRPT